MEMLDQEKMMFVFFNIGDIYKKNNENKEAFKYQNRALEFTTLASDESEGTKNIMSKNDKEELMKMFTIVADDYNEKGKYAEALQYYIKALEYAEAGTDKYNYISPRIKKAILILLGEYRESIINEMEKAWEQNDIEKMDELLRGRKK